MECGGITSLAISADHSTIASGHANGSIFTWDVSRPARPFLHIPPLDKLQLVNRKDDGHMVDTAVLHVGFLGTRHTALVSADDNGMAFSHLATRGMGTVGRVVKSTRILGRYPETSPSTSTIRKPSSVLAFSPLPLGNIEQPTDDLGLTALLTPYLLVVVSTTPIAQTQFKLSRSKDVAAYSAMTGCLAWFPSVEMKSPTSVFTNTVSRTKLVYCWSNILSTLEIEVSEVTDSIEENKGPNLRFQPHGGWQSDEPILAVQWISKSVLAVLTITQRLIILEDNPLRVADSSDMNSKHIYHQDLFSRQLQPVVDTIEQDDTFVHGVISDAYYMSFKTYKGRLFVLGVNEISMGTLSNWADRLVILMEAGDCIAAIELATSYYNGDTDIITVGLSEDDATRHSTVKAKLLEMISASLRYTFRDDPESDDAHHSRPDTRALAEATFTACLSMHETDFLFDEAYEWYADASTQDVFLYTLEPYIIGGKIRAVPPVILKDLMNWYAALGLGDRLEEMIISLEPYTMDVDQVTTICKEYKLYDALIYVWNQAFADYVTPLIELMALLSDQDYEQRDGSEDKILPFNHATKLFPYMAYTLTGRAYPDGSEMPSHNVVKAKSSLYGFLFSSSTMRWPQPNGKLIKTYTDHSPDPQYPYIRLLLHFNTPDFMSMMNEAFEDSFLNGRQEQMINGIVVNQLRNQASGLSINRQRIVNIMLEIMAAPDFGAQERIYLDIFIARNLPKFPQFILLAGSTLHNILTELCEYPGHDTFDERQLSVEYLLSMYHPTDTKSLIPLLVGAGFFRILKSTYRKSRQYAKWLEAYFEDPEDRDAVFECIRDCLRSTTSLSGRQVREVKTVIIDYAQDLADIDTARMASCLQDCAPELLSPVFGQLEQDSQAQFKFLQSMFEPSAQPPHVARHLSEEFAAVYTERYVKLMCNYNPRHVADFAGLLKTGDLRLSEILPTMESSGVVDAAVVLMARDGLVRDAMNRLTKHLGMLKTALTGLLSAMSESPDRKNTGEAAEDLLESVEKYVKLGIWLCQGQMRNTQTVRSPKQQSRIPLSETTESDLTLSELLWLDHIDTVVSISRAVTTAIETIPIHTLDASAESHRPSTDSPHKIADALRNTVQQSFTALLAATSAVPCSGPKTANPPGPQPPLTPSSATTTPPRFLPILHAFLTRASITSRSTSSLHDLRAVLSSIFSAYAFEEQLLTLANDFIDKDVFGSVQLADSERRRGWRPKGQGGVCEGCGRKTWGRGAGGAIWEAWRKKRMMVEEDRRRRWENGGEDRGKGKGRAKGAAGFADGGGSSGIEGGGEKNKMQEEVVEMLDSLVVFTCGHLWHRKCLEWALLEKEGGDWQGTFRCLVCSS